MTFRVGQIVECVDDSPDRIGRPVVVVKGARYTISATFEWLGEEGVRLAYVDPGRAPGWQASRFRPIVECKADISFAHEILKKASKKQGADA